MQHRVASGKADTLHGTAKASEPWILGTRMSYVRMLHYRILAGTEVCT